MKAIQRRMQWVRQVSPLRIVIVLAALLMSGVGTQAQAADVPSYFEPDGCPFVAEGFACGWLIVPEDHTQPETSKTIRLAVAIAQATGANPQPDPVIYLAGGPGGGTVQYAPAAVFIGALGQLRQQRDIIILDQRGSGLSQPALDCPELENVMFEPRSDSETMLQPVRDCRERLTAEGIDLALYNTVQNAADVAALRVALGYEQVNLFGGSYGTLLGQMVMQNHPEGIRSVLLDSTLPMQTNTFIKIAENFDAALTRLEAGCAADIVCRLAYPNVRGVYYELFDRLNETPLLFTVEHPVTEEEIDITLDGYTLADMLFMGLYSRQSIQMMPAVLYDLMSGELGLLEQALQPSVQTSSALSFGMFFSMLCSGHGSPGDQTLDAVAAIGDAYPEAVAMRQSILGEAGFRACQIWDVPPVFSDVPAVQSDIPTLVMAGEYDPVTPPIWGEQVVQTLSKGFFFEYPGLGHMATVDQCPVQMAVNFLNNPLIAPNGQCIEDMRAVYFTVNAAATRPVGQMGALLLGGVALWSTAVGVNALRRNPHQVAWRAALKAMGWMPVLATVSGLVFLIVSQNGGMPWSNKAQILELVIPLALGVQAALLFSPDDEPALEVLLACPRKIAWLLLERLGVVLLAQAGIALVGMVVLRVLVPEMQDNLGAMLLRWIPPALFMSGVGVYVTLRSRVSTFGAVVVGLLWFAFVFWGRYFLPGQPILWPLNYVQPIMWIGHPYLQPSDLSVAEYTINRIFVAAAGLVLIALAAHRLHDEERLLLGVKKSQQKRER